MSGVAGPPTQMVTLPEGTMTLGIRDGTLKIHFRYLDNVANPPKGFAMVPSGGTPAYLADLFALKLTDSGTAAINTALAALQTAVATQPWGQQLGAMS